jgi:hypothetical protein
MSPGWSLGVRRPRGVGGLGREHIGTVQPTHRAMLVLFHLVGMNKVRGIPCIIEKRKGCHPLWT